MKSKRFYNTPDKGQVDMSLDPDFPDDFEDRVIAAENQQPISTCYGGTISPEFQEKLMEIAREIRRRDVTFGRKAE